MAMIDELALHRFIINLIHVILGVISLFLVLRILFLLIPANSTTPFVVWIYSVSAALMSPFRGIVSEVAVGNGGVFDWVAIISLVAYLVLGALVISVVDSLFAASEDRYVNRNVETYHTIRRRY